MKTRSIIPSVRFFVTLVSCCLCLGEVIHANCVQFRTADIFTPASIGFTQTVVQLPVADAFDPDENPFESLRQPWYIRIWPESQVLRILMIGGIVMGIKAILFKKPGTPSSPQSPQQPVQRVAQPQVSPAIQPPPTNLHSTVSGWYYQANGTEVGPFDENALRQLKRAGVISPATFLRPANGGDWTSYASVFGFN